MQNEVCHKTGQLYAKAAYPDMQRFRMLVQLTMQVFGVLIALVLILPIGMMVTPTFMEITERWVSSEH
jgi:hypothetical protein